MALFEKKQLGQGEAKGKPEKMPPEKDTSIFGGRPSITEGELRDFASRDPAFGFSLPEKLNRVQRLFGGTGYIRREGVERKLRELEMERHYTMARGGAPSDKIKELNIDIEALNRILGK